MHQVKSRFPAISSRAAIPHVLCLSDLISEGEFVGERMFIYADLNMPQDGTGSIVESTRICAPVPAVKAALDAGVAIIVTSHLDHPTEGELKPEGSLAPVAKRLSGLLDRDIKLIQNWADDVDVASGQVVLLENCRVNKGGKKNSDELAQKMAKLCDVYVNDAFGTAHHAETTTHGIARFAPIACAGPLLTAELDALGEVLGQPARPLVAIMAGSKVLTKLTILKSLADKVDNLTASDGIANTFMLVADLKIDKSLAEAGLMGDIKAIIEMLAARSTSMSIPVDIVYAKEFSATATATIKDMAGVADNGVILDIGPKTATQLAEQLKSTGIIVWSGPVGVSRFDQFDNNAKVLAEATAASSGFSIAGSGDTLAAITKYNTADKVGYISTDDGALLELLGNKTLSAVEILEQHAQNQVAVA